ncbi:hypothetical protein ASC87_14020 [Rhizobacter sp. Root1221]|nr:hypothetical protein ASC87_14020 [Rhizobacter sp. Root1221]
MMRWLRPRAAGALSRVMVAVDNSLPVHTGGGSLANATALAAGEIRPQLLNTRPAIPTGAIASSAEAGVSTASKTTGQAPTTRVRASQALEGALKKEVTQTAETAVKKEATQTTKGVIKGDEDAAASTSTAMKDGEEEALKATPRNPAAKDLAAGSQVPKHSESASNPAVEPLQYVGALSNGNVANDVVPHREPQVMAATGTDSAAPITSEVVGTPSIAGVTDPMVASGSKMTPKTAEYLRVNRIANQAGYFVREAKPSKADLKAIAAYYRKPTPQLGGTAGHAARGMAPKGADVVFLDTVGELKMLTVVKGESINQAFAQAARYAKKLGKKNVVVRVMDMTNGIIYDFFPK